MVVTSDAELHFNIRNWCFHIPATLFLDLNLCKAREEKHLKMRTESKMLYSHREDTEEYQSCKILFANFNLNLPRNQDLTICV